MGAKVNNAPNHSLDWAKERVTAEPETYDFASDAVLLGGEGEGCEGCSSEGCWGILEDVQAAVAGEELHVGEAEWGGVGGSGSILARA